MSCLDLNDGAGWCVRLLMLAGVLTMEACEFGRTFTEHDLSIVPRGDISLEHSTVAAVRAVPSLVCELRTQGVNADAFAVHIALPAANAGQPLYVVESKSIDCSAGPTTAVASIRAKREGAEWQNAQLTVHACLDADAAAAWLQLTAIHWNDPVDPSTRQFIWNGAAWITR